MSDDSWNVTAGEVIEFSGSTRYATPFVLPKEYFAPGPTPNVLQKKGATLRPPLGRSIDGVQILAVIRQPGNTKMGTGDPLGSVNCWVEKDSVTVAYTGTIIAPERTGQYELVVFRSAKQAIASEPSPQWPTSQRNSTQIPLETIRVIPVSVK